MGKQKRQRQKFHTPSSTKSADTTSESLNLDVSNPLNFTPTENLFANININLNTLSKLKDDDTRSIKSFKSIKSEKSGDKQMSKKDKLKLRREYLHQRIDTINQMKKQARLRNKRKKTTLVGDTNPLHDALPFLESLISSRPKIKEAPKIAKNRAIQKSTARKKSHVHGVQTFKKIMSNKEFKANPLHAITEHVKAMAEKEKLMGKKK